MKNNISRNYNNNKLFLLKFKRNKISFKFIIKKIESKIFFNKFIIIIILILILISILNLNFNTRIKFKKF